MQDRGLSSGLRIDQPGHVWTDYGRPVRGAPSAPFTRSDPRGRCEDQARKQSAHVIFALQDLAANPMGRWWRGCSSAATSKSRNSTAWGPLPSSKIVVPDLCWW